MLVTPSMFMLHDVIDHSTYIPVVVETDSPAWRLISAKPNITLEDHNSTLIQLVNLCW